MNGHYWINRENSGWPGRGFVYTNYDTDRFPNYLAAGVLRNLVFLFEEGPYLDSV